MQERSKGSGGGGERRKQDVWKLQIVRENEKKKRDFKTFLGDLDSGIQLIAITV